MSYIHPAALAARRKYWTRPDAYRFAPPGTPEAKPPGWLDPSATRVRWKEAREEEARAQEALVWEARQRELLEIRRELDELKCELAARRAAWERADEAARIKCDIAFERFVQTYKRYAEQQKAGFNPDQPRDELGKWTDAGDATESDQNDVNLDAEDPLQASELLAQDRRSFVAPGPGQEPRRDLVDLDAIANHPPIRAQIDEAWAASDSNGFGREQGFWISRNEATGEIFTRPFANPGGAMSIVPGARPSDAIAFFHTHPARPDFGGYPDPSPGDLRYAERMGLPGLLQSHGGMYYFGPLLRTRRSP